MAKKEDRDASWKAGGNFDGIFKGLGNLVEKLGDLAEMGEQLSRTGEINFGDKAKDLKGVYGFSVKVGLGDQKDQGVKVEPFGNIRKDEKTGESIVQEIREPMVDIFEEDDYTLVVAEMPGISAEDVRVGIKDDLLTIYAERGDKKYRKEVLLPASYPREKMKIFCNNGILEIKCIN